MEILSAVYTPTILFIILLGLLVIGSIVELYNPAFVPKEMHIVLQNVTLAVLGLFICFYVLMFFLSFMRTPYREGFQDSNQDTKKLVDNWKTMVKDNKLEEICKIYNDIYEKIFKVEKGIPPESFTDEQAREKTLKIFKDVIPSGILSCSTVDKIKNVPDIDTLFTISQGLPDSFLVQGYETAKGCRALLKKNVDEIQKSLTQDITVSLEKKKPKESDESEGFVDASVGICSPEITEERRKFLREKKLSEKAQSCLLPEEVPLDKKDGYVKQKYDKIMITKQDYMKNTKESLEKILADCAMYKKQLDDFKKKAESGDLIKDISI